MTQVTPKNQPASNNLTPYEQAYLEWSARIGDARTQAQNWQKIGILSLIVLILFLLLFMGFFSMKKTYVYVAQVTPNQETQLIHLPQTLKTTSAEQAYFINQFITNIMSLPIDPVIARQNWFNAFDFVSGQAVAQLTQYAQNTNPLQSLGQTTKSVQINNFNVVSDQSIRFTWTVTSYNNQGQTQNQITQSGIFTITQGSPPGNQVELLKNPFGLKITFFSINNEGSSS
ncbi:MAG: type IV secretion system protein [Gammaproteobacteria bacterium]|nr:type IV secretion system protein [Gammaproteobacteria bacterium]